MQIIINGIITGSVYILIALGFAIIYQIVKFFHFAHGVVFTAGAYLTYFFYASLQFPLLSSILSATLLCIILGCVIELFIYRHLIRKTSSSLVLLVASLGVYIFSPKCYFNALWGWNQKHPNRNSRRRA